MKIQLISNNYRKILTQQKCKKTSLSEPESFNMYDINIIDLQSENLWENQRDSTSSINRINDFMSIHTLVESNNNYLIFALPQNFEFKKHYISNGYLSTIKLKDMLNNLQLILSYILPQKTTGQYTLIFENSTTCIKEEHFCSAFYLESKFKPVTCSLNSNHATTIQISDKCFITTLDISSKDCSLDSLLSVCGILTKEKNYPEWLSIIEKFDDSIQKDTISHNNAQILELQRQNDQAIKKLEENMHFKSILVTNGKELVTVVFEMLEKLLSCDLSQFKDENKEDFLIKTGEITLIGEIKGVTSNVKSEHISQLDVHYQSYIEELPSNTSEKVCSLLIINPCRTKALKDREPIHGNQIKLAKRNGSLIITTELLLTLFEQFLKNEISTEKIKALFSTQTGLLDLSNIE